MKRNSITKQKNCRGVVCNCHAPLNRSVIPVDCAANICACEPQTQSNLLCEIQDCHHTNSYTACHTEGQLASVTADELKKYCAETRLQAELAGQPSPPCFDVLAALSLSAFAFPNVDSLMRVQPMTLATSSLSDGIVILQRRHCNGPWTPEPQPRLIAVARLVWVQGDDQRRHQRRRESF